MYVCIYVCMYVYIYVCVYVHVCMRSGMSLLEEATPYPLDLEFVKHYQVCERHLYRSHDDDDVNGTVCTVNDLYHNVSVWPLMPRESEFESIYACHICIRACVRVCISLSLDFSPYIYICIYNIYIPYIYIYVYKICI